ncbi:MAG: hypothetical protein Ta2B_22760 [Termitinemataceae bacterium]|nr:MAG: hypothetical protein Ta2B_22760 [Termitinemataceae bacterium]
MLTRFTTFFFILCFASVFISTPVFSIEAPELLWRQSLGGNVLCSPEYKEQALVSVCSGGALVTLGATGKELWRYKAGGRLEPFLAKGEAGVTYICRTNNMLQAVNRVGKLIWQKRLSSKMIAAPIVGYDGRLFIFLSEKIMCLNTQGVYLWQITLESPLLFEAQDDNRGGFFCVLKDGTLLNVNAFSKVNATLLPEIPEHVVVMDAASRDGSQKFLVIYAGGKLELFEDSKSVGSLAPLQYSAVCTAHYNNMTAILLSNSELIIWTLDKGITKRMQSTISIRSGLAYKMTYNENGISILSDSVSLHFDNKYELVWKMNVQNTSSVPVIGDDIFFVSGNDWILYAYTLPKSKNENKTYTAKNTKHFYGINIADSTFDSPPFVKFNSQNEYEKFLDGITLALRKGDISESEVTWTRMLMAASKAKNPFAESGTPENLPLRITAINLLGKIASPEIMPFLAHYFITEHNITVKTAIATAMGNIGFDTDGDALNAFESVVTSDLPPSNERFLCEVAKSITTICKFQGQPLLAKGVSLLVAIKTQSHSQIVEKTVQKYLDDLFAPIR